MRTRLDIIHKVPEDIFQAKTFCAPEGTQSILIRKAFKSPPFYYQFIYMYYTPLFKYLLNGAWCIDAIGSI